MFYKFYNFNITFKANMESRTTHLTINELIQLTAYLSDLFSISSTDFWITFNNKVYYESISDWRLIIYCFLRTQKQTQTQF